MIKLFTKKQLFLCIIIGLSNITANYTCSAAQANPVALWQYEGHRPIPRNGWAVIRINLHEYRLARERENRQQRRECICASITGTIVVAGTGLASYFLYNQ